MISSIISYGMSFTNYKTVNVNNIYNTFIALIDLCKTDDEVQNIKKLIKINIGQTFYNEFQQYVMKKLGPEYKLFKGFEKSL